MKALLICPVDRPQVQFLAESISLATVPLLGQSLIEYWLSHLATTAIEEVCILAADRAEQVRCLVGGGARWGIKARVVGESRELTVAQAHLKYKKELGNSGILGEIAVLDHFPARPERPLFTSYGDWFAALVEWMPKALTADRVGHRLMRPGVWLGMNAHLSPAARLIEPCWIGQNAIVGARAVIGPRAIVENAVFIEPDTEITNSYIGPHTFVGRYTEIRESLAWGNTLVQLNSGSVAKVADPFVLGSLRQRRRADVAGWLGRMARVHSQSQENVAVPLKGFVIDRQS